MSIQFTIHSHRRRRHSAHYTPTTSPWFTLHTDDVVTDHPSHTDVVAMVHPTHRRRRYTSPFTHRWRRHRSPFTPVPGWRWSNLRRNEPAAVRFSHFRYSTPLPKIIKIIIMKRNKTMSIRFIFNNNTEDEVLKMFRNPNNTISKLKIFEMM